MSVPPDPVNPNSAPKTGPRRDPYQPATPAARAQAAALLAGMRHAVLAVPGPDGTPHLARIACQADPDGVPVARLSTLSAHARALAADPRAGLLVEDAGGKGDPMTRPRLSLTLRAAPAPEDAARRARWLAASPAATVWMDLPDFRWWRLVPTGGLLVAGFGAAHRLAEADLAAGG